jgi:hypothetical protein
MLKLIDSVPLTFYIILSLFLGLAPFFPEPHLVEKLRMLQAGELVRLIDIFDLVLHATPWCLLLIKLILILKTKPTTSEAE